MKKEDNNGQWLSIWRNCINQQGKKANPQILQILMACRKYILTQFCSFSHFFILKFSLHFWKGCQCCLVYKQLELKWKRSTELGEAWEAEFYGWYSLLFSGWVQLLAQCMLRGHSLNTFVKQFAWQKKKYTKYTYTHGLGTAVALDYRSFMLLWTQSTNVVSYYPWHTLKAESFHNNSWNFREAENDRTFMTNSLN